MTATKNPDEKKTFKHKKIVIILAIILSVIIALTASFFITVKVGEARLRKSLVSDENIDANYEIDENAIYHNGKAYYYNQDLINILLISEDN